MKQLRSPKSEPVGGGTIMTSIGHVIVFANVPGSASSETRHMHGKIRVL